MNDILIDLGKDKPKSKIVRDLGLHLNDQGIICCRGRITNADKPLVTRYPVLLPKESNLTKLIVNNSHESCMHSGMGDTLAHVRQNYWIPRGRQVVKSILKQCMHCRRYDQKTMEYPGPPALPTDRVRKGRPFEVTGVDYTGAIQITGEEVPRKLYICLFTCAVSRAVHLEVVEDMTAESFINAFRRFAARRSCPRKIISDNGTNFVGAAPLLRFLFEHPRVKEILQVRRCSWHFITPRAPWQNGFTERLIGVVKNCLRKALHNSRINTDELKTVVTEIENKINNRPLTYLDSSNVNIEPLTPAHLLYGHRLETIPQINIREELEDPTEGATHQSLLEKYHHLAERLKAWDQHWSNDYLLSLRERFYGASPAQNKYAPKVGDIVILKGNQPRSNWPLGKIITLYPDDDGVIRSMKVGSGGTESLRTINKLVPLELSEVPEEEPTQTPGDADPRTQRPRRAAAQGSQSHWRQLISGGHIT